MYFHLVTASLMEVRACFTGYVSLGLALALPDDGKLIACDKTDAYPSTGWYLLESVTVADECGRGCGT
jgi:predicted O-methyltransferase YrrM